jgi:hypothetical protein
LGSSHQNTQEPDIKAAFLWRESCPGVFIGMQVQVYPRNMNGEAKYSFYIVDLKNYAAITYGARIRISITVCLPFSFRKKLSGCQEQKIGIFLQLLATVAF